MTEGLSADTNWAHHTALKSSSRRSSSHVNKGPLTTAKEDPLPLMLVLTKITKGPLGDQEVATRPGLIKP